MLESLHPIQSGPLGRSDKERRFRRSGKVIWLYGLSGAGKSTLGSALARRLADEGYTTQILDGDNLRLGLNRDLGFTDPDRTENVRRVAEVAKLFTQAGVVTICALITPLRAHRAVAREIISPADFIEVHLAAPYAVCARRDPKGLYAKAASGQLPLFTGRDSTFEPPATGDAALVIPTDEYTPDECLLRLYAYVAERLAGS